MSMPAGYILHLSEARQNVFDQRDDDESFAEAVDEFQHSRHQPLVCFIVQSKRELTHVGLASRGSFAGSRQRRLNIRSIQEIRAVGWSKLRKVIPRQLQKHFDRQVKRSGLLSPKVFESLVAAIIAARPETAGLLNRFLTERRARIGALSEVVHRNLALQKEAVSTALDIAGLKRDELSGWDFDSQQAEPVSFISGLPKVRLMEDQMVIHDLQTFPGFDAIQSAEFAATEFASDTRRLTIVLANKVPLELQTGADLIYFNETFRCFLMVQYKVMEGDDDEGAIFRFPNDQLTQEIERMENILAALRAYPVSAEADDFRFNDNPFFLKLCPRIRFDPDGTALSKGMYLPLDYWKVISLHPNMQGPKGGRQISYRNVRRYLDNSQFATLVAGSWIGTNLHQSDLLKQAIYNTLETGKAAVIAIDRELDDRHRRSANSKDQDPSALSADEVLVNLFPEL
jgi:hypothetical protein